MEIYTGDLIGMAQDCAVKISNKLGVADYVVEDECCNLQRDIRNKLHERLEAAFRELIREQMISDMERSYLILQEGGLQDKLFKIINEI
jgi:hypothetical protein